MIDIESTKSKPKVYYNQDDNRLQIHGRSVLKNMDDNFFYPIFNFLKKTKENGGKGLKVEFYLDYFNTSSHPSLVKIFELASDIDDSEIYWLYEQNDMEMMEIGNELSKYSPKSLIVKQILD